VTDTATKAHDKGRGRRKGCRTMLVRQTTADSLRAIAGLLAGKPLENVRRL